MHGMGDGEMARWRDGGPFAIGLVVVPGTPLSFKESV